ncbi:MAG: serine/threonine-protein kinase [Candidatus Promineifilaceae bacterium]
MLLQGRYRLDGELGRGGMGVVFRGYDTLLLRPVAIKVASVGGLEADQRARLLVEAQAAASLNHPHIVSIYDAGELALDPAAAGEPAGPHFFLVMELVAGGSLRHFRSEGLREQVRLAGQVCAALQHAHARGIVHRDLKPENVLVLPGQPAEGDSGPIGATIKLADFGLARLAGGHSLTREGTLMGTPAYLAPEVIKGARAGPPADMYALGILLYTLACGQSPYLGEGIAEVLSQHIYAKPAAPSQHDPLIPRELDELLLALLQKEPELRPKAGAAWLALAEIEAQLGLPAPAEPFRLAFLNRLAAVGLADEAADMAGRQAHQRWLGSRAARVQLIVWAALGASFAGALAGPLTLPLFQLAFPAEFSENLAFTPLAAWLIALIVVSGLIGLLRGAALAALAGLADSLWPSRARAWLPPRRGMLADAGERLRRPALVSLAGLLDAFFLISFSLADLLSPGVAPTLYIPVQFAIAGLRAGVLSLVIPRPGDAPGGREQAGRLLTCLLLLLPLTAVYVLALYRQQLGLTFLNQYAFQALLAIGLALALSRLNPFYRPGQ